MAAKTIECFLMDYPLIDDFTAFLAREAWNAACEFMVEKFTYAQHTQPAICAWLKAHDLCSVWGSSKSDACTVCEAAHKQQASA